MREPRIRADFNGLFADLLCLSHEDTARDETGQQVQLQAGMVVTAYDDDTDELGRSDNLLATGVVEESPEWLRCKGSRWVLRIGGRGVIHESDLPGEKLTTIYMYLLDEGTEVWRPVGAKHLGGDRYQVISKNPDPDDEKWEFSTGDVVRCKVRPLSGGEKLVAYELIQASA
jgi:hypothetical protein